MLTHPADPSRTLVEVADLGGAPAHPLVAEQGETLRAVVGWARDYLCGGHAELGRRGHVCPFAKTALDGGTFYLAVQPGVPERVEDVAELLLGYRDWFEELCTVDTPRAPHQTILVTFPDLAGEDVRRVIDGTQAILKPDYVARGLMIGEFHDGPPEAGGLWNPDFRPLRSPVPLLAIRNMVPTDFPFLRHDPEFVAIYLGRFGDRIPAHLRQQVAETVDSFGLTPAPVPMGTEVPLSTAQRRLWFLSRLDPGNAVHHLTRAVRLRGPVDADLLADRFAGVLARHPALRVRLAERDGQPVATLAADTDTARPPLPVTGVDDSAGDSAGDEVSATRLARAIARRPFDLRRGPLLRAELLRLAEDDHVLVLVAHRIAADDSSLDLVATELGGTVTEPVEDVPVGVAEDDLAHWVRRLADAPTLNLPTDHRRPRTQSYRGATHRFTLPADALHRLRAVAGGPVLPGLLAAFDVVLARHSGQHDLLVGMPAGAPRSSVGPLESTVVLRADLSDEPTFLELTARCAADAADALRHRGAAFEDVVAALDVERNLDTPPVFQARLAVREDPPAVPRLHGVAAEEFPIDVGATEVDLTLYAWPAANGGLSLALEYSTDLFAAPTVHQLAEHLVTVVLSAATRPDLPVHRIPLLADGEYARLLAVRQGPVLALPEPATALPLLAAAAAAHPDAVAVRADDGDVTYGELHERAAQVAHVLRAWGVGPDVAVGVCVDRSAAMVVALLGVWLSGAAYVPLDPGFPPDRLRHMLTDAAVDVVVTHEPVRRRVGSLFDEIAGVVCLDEDADVLAEQPTVPPAEPPGPDDLAYVIYTSGSTGRPKGVEIPHRAVANLLVAFDHALPLTAADRWLAVTTLSFDIAALELFHPLASGASVIVASGQETADGAALHRRAVESAATVMQATPATWRLLLAAGDLPTRLRTRLCGGEAVPRDLADDLGADGARVWNVYGPTETTVWSAAGEIEPAPAPIEIGPPIANTGIHVLDATGTPAPVGVVGEVHIGGLGLARGYRNLPELTRERFVPDPTRPGERLYATGDLARYRPNGRVEFLGRTDHQVKVRGFRIELGELESVLRAHDGVAAAVVTTWPGPDGSARLVAYVVESGAGDASWPTLREWLRRSLPDYMVPATAVALTELPLTPNGKIDRAALPEPIWGSMITVRQEPRNPIEKSLAELWREVLGGVEVGVTDDFFALGGHSLLGAKLLARVRAYFDTEVPMRSLFEEPTVAGLATVLERLELAPGQATAIAELRQQIAEMPDDEVAALLEQST